MNIEVDALQIFDFGFCENCCMCKICMLVQSCAKFVFYLK